MIQAHKGILQRMKGINYHHKDFFQIGIRSSEVAIKVLEIMRFLVYFGIIFFNLLQS